MYNTQTEVRVFYLALDIYLLLERIQEQEQKVKLLELDDGTVLTGIYNEDKGI